MKLAHAALALVTLSALTVAAPSRAEWPFDFVGSTSPAAPAITPVRVYHLAGAVQERASPWQMFGSGAPLILPELLRQIAADARAPEVKTLVLKLGGVGLGPAQAEELASAIAEARKAKKRVVAWVEAPGLATLLGTATADRVIVPPETSAFVPGLRAEVSFYKDLLGTLGVEADFVAVGQYKSAMEPFTRTTMSDPARANLEALIDGIYRSIVDGIAGPRKLDPKKIEAAIDRGLLTAEAARAAGLVDELQYWSEALALEEKSGAAGLAWPKPAEGPQLGSLMDLFKLIGGDAPKAAEETPKVAVLVADGPIVEGHDPSDFMNTDNVIATEDLLDALHEIENDPNVKALVVRVDSPGGSALASDMIWRELDRVGKKLPVVTSMGNVAASGGYYIAVAGKKIFADATTLTGSIGVFGGKLVYGDLLDKIGVHTVVIARGKNAGMFSALGRFTDDERAVMRESMEHTYKTFVNRVAKGRNMSFDAVDKVAQGRVWTGRQALEVGLVDKLGGLADAVREAARLSKAWKDGDVPEVKLWPKKQTLFDLLGKGQAAGPERLRLGAGELMAMARALPRPISAAAGRIARVIGALLDDTPVLALMPMAIELR